MNERLKELKKQAMVKEYGHGCWGETESYNVLDPDKFAELIIRECADIAYGTYWRDPEGVRGTHIKEAIKEHFGVGDESC